MQSHLWRVSLLAVLAACASCSGGSKDEKAEDTAAAAETAVPSSAKSGTTAAESGNQLGALVDLIVAEANELPRAEFDPAALSKKLGTNPQAHFEWVRDNTWWAPYRGLLRGSKGVMLDRVGSNLDRAVLLGDLLRHAGYKVRIAHARIPETRATELLGRIRPMPEQRIASKPESNKAVEDAQTLVRSQSDLLYAAVRDAASNGRTGDRAAVTAMQDHWWIERDDGGKWIAMDVLSPDARIGNVIVAASNTSEWKSTEPAPAIPDSDWHAVEIRVLVERYENGSISESTVLQTTLRPANVIDRPIMLAHMPRPWPASLADAATDPNALGNAAVNVKEWIPYLRVGEEFIVQSAFTEGGDLKLKPFDSQSDINETGGGGLMGGMDMALGGGETVSSYVTAEWIEYEVHVPDEKSQKLRRPVFDLLGPVKRSAAASGFDASTNELLVKRYEALLSATDILLQSSGFTSAFVANLASAGVVANQAALKQLEHERDAVKARDAASELLGRIGIWGPLPDFVLWRSAISGDPGDWFIDRPNILNYRLTRPVVNADRSPVRGMMDIASNSIGVRRDASRSPFEVRLHLGVADTVAEMFTLDSDLRMKENTASLFATTGAEPGRRRLIAPGDAKSVQALGWPEDVAARLSASIDAGFMSVVLTTPVELGGKPRLGWWRVDPGSGETIGVMDTGYHASTTEDAVTRTRIALREFLDDHWMEWGRMSVRQAAGRPIGASVQRDMAIRQAAMRFREALLEFAEATGTRVPLPPP